MKGVPSVVVGMTDEISLRVYPHDGYNSISCNLQYMVPIDTGVCNINVRSITDFPVGRYSLDDGVCNMG